MLSWALPQVEPLKKRAYLGRFLVDIEVPQEFLYEEVRGSMPCGGAAHCRRGPRACPWLAQATVLEPSRR